MSAEVELRRVVLELEHARVRAAALTQAVSRDPDAPLRAMAAEVRVAALRARAAQLRRSIAASRRFGSRPGGAERTLPLSLAG